MDEKIKRISNVMELGLWASRTASLPMLGINGYKQLCDDVPSLVKTMYETPYISAEKLYNQYQSKNNKLTANYDDLNIKDRLKLTFIVNLFLRSKEAALVE